ncbi:MAG TPA: phage tail tube protein, partial [Anaerolineales bacterium]|nr:phage tail tube protein [Anaerolineales bacterium]
PGTKSWTISGTGNLAFDATNGWSALFTAWNNQTVVAVVFQNAVTGDKKYSGNAYISSLTLTSDGNNGPVTFDFEFTGTGALTEATI